MNSLTPDELQTLLEWAGLRLVALPEKGLKPAEPGCLWPDYSQDKWEITEFRGRLPMRAAAPSKFEIPIMDLILTLPNSIERIYIRRIVQLRLLIHPITGRYLQNWGNIARIVKSDRKTVRRWHARGLQEAAKKADPAVVWRITNFFVGDPIPP